MFSVYVALFSKATCLSAIYLSTFSGNYWYFLSFTEKFTQKLLSKSIPLPVWLICHPSSDTLAWQVDLVAPDVSLISDEGNLLDQRRH